jgi:hypothetical protein
VRILEETVEYMVKANEDQVSPQPDKSTYYLAKTAANWLETHGVNAKAAVPSLIKLLTLYGGHSYESAAVRALAAIGPDAAAAIPSLEALLRNQGLPFDSVKRELTAALRKINPNYSGNKPDRGRKKDNQ